MGEGGGRSLVRVETQGGKGIMYETNTTIVCRLEHQTKEAIRDKTAGLSYTRRVGSVVDNLNKHCRKIKLWGEERETNSTVDNMTM